MTSTSPKATRTSAPVGNAANAVYGLGIIGAAIYFIQHASSFWMGLLGIVEAIVWPVFFVYKSLEFFHLP